MGFIASGCSIILGGILGGILRKKIYLKNFTALSLGVMIISLVGLFENILTLTDGKIVGEHTVPVSLAVIFGCLIGDALKLEDRIYALSKSRNTATVGVVDTILFFGIGGLQITGPILYALKGDSLQLIIKAMIDFPFSLMFGATYGKRISLSSIPVVAMQIIIALIAYASGAFFSEDLLAQICSIGYVILFFSGFNMICSPEKKIKNINILPGIFLIIVYNIVLEVLGK